MELGKEQKLEQLEKVLHSRTLQNSESLKAFLRFVVEQTLANREAQLKEYTIATEVFGRNSDYDPRIDSVVRVQAGRLRTKLQEYYATEGKSDRIVIDLPKGHYHPVFNYTCHETAAHETAAVVEQPAPVFDLLARTSGASAEAPAPPPVSNEAPARAGNGHAAHAEALRTEAVRAPSASLRRPLVWALATAVLLLVVAVVALTLANRDLRRRVAAEPSIAAADDYQRVWATFLDDPEPPLLVLSNPVVYRFVNKADPPSLTQRALQLNEAQVRLMTDAPEFQGQQLPIDERAPQLIPSVNMYTGMGEAIGLYRLSNLFRSANRDILLKQSRHVSATDLKYRNVILLGSIYVNEWSRKLPLGESFSYTDAATIENRAPQAGEEHEYRPQFDEKTGQLRLDYALITVKPNISGENTVMTLAGIYSEGTEAAAEFITTKNHLSLLSQRLRQAGENNLPPKYYQALLKVNVENGTPTTISLVALHPLRPSAD